MKKWAGHEYKCFRPAKAYITGPQQQGPVMNMQGGLAMSLEKNFEKYEEPNTIEKLAEEIRDGAYKSMESLWSAFLEVGDLDMVRATDTVIASDKM